jgi:hypothetical protein
MLDAGYSILDEHWLAEESLWLWHRARRITHIAE